MLNVGVSNPVLLQVIRVARDVAKALARVHDKGIIHLDISARNIFLDAYRKPKIGDFGCAAIESEMLATHRERAEKLREYRADGASQEDIDRDYRLYIEHCATLDETVAKRHQALLNKPKAVAWMVISVSYTHLTLPTT